MIIVLLVILLVVIFFSASGVTAEVSVLGVNTPAVENVNAAITVPDVITTPAVTPAAKEPDVPYTPPTEEQMALYYELLAARDVAQPVSAFNEVTN